MRLVSYRTTYITVASFRSMATATNVDGRATIELSDNIVGDSQRLSLFRPTGDRCKIKRTLP